MTQVAEVFEYIEDCVRDHKFGSLNTWTNHRLYKATLDNELELICRQRDQKQIVTIPEGSEMVVYRRPQTTMARNVTIACFHHPDKDTRTIIFASGRASVRKESAKSVYDYGPGGPIVRQSPSLSTSN